MKMPSFQSLALRAARLLAPAAIVLVASGCAGLQSRPQVAVLEPEAIRAAAKAVPPTPPPAPGSIYQPTLFHGLFEDRRARQIGDLLTIQIAENNSASKSASTSLNRDGKLSGGITALPLLPSSALNRANIGTNSSSALDSKGQTGNDNTFTGVITVTVADVMPNGNLVVTGEKQVGINQNVDLLRFSGVVSPATIQVGNVVSSTQVADARLEFTGRGDIDRAQTTGWLTRFFMSWSPI